MRANSRGRYGSSRSQRVDRGCSEQAVKLPNVLSDSLVCVGRGVGTSYDMLLWRGSMTVRGGHNWRDLMHVASSKRGRIRRLFSFASQMTVMTAEPVGQITE